MEKLIFSEEYLIYSGQDPAKADFSFKGLAEFMSTGDIRFIKCDGFGNSIVYKEQDTQKIILGFWVNPRADFKTNAFLFRIPIDEVINNKNTNLFGEPTDFPAKLPYSDDVLN